jgi:hypothetical protein
MLCGLTNSEGKNIIGQSRENAGEARTRIGSEEMAARIRGRSQEGA